MAQIFTPELMQMRHKCTQMMAAYKKANKSRERSVESIKVSEKSKSIKHKANRRSSFKNVELALANLKNN